MKILLSLLNKDFKQEFRSKETFFLLLSLSLTLAIAASFAINFAFLDKQSEVNLYPGFIWLIFIFSSTVSIGRTFEYEFKNAALSALILTKIDTIYIYISKVLVSFCITFLTHLFTSLFLAILINLNLNFVFNYLILSALVCFAYSSISILFAPMTSSSQLSSLILSIIVLPLLFPLIFCAIQINLDILNLNYINFDSAWFNLLMALNLLYFSLGMIFFRFVSK